MATDAKEIEAAAAEVAAATAAAPAESGEDLIKSLVGIVDRLSKGGKFGDTDKAHNGNDYDKSNPMGGGDTPDTYDSAEEEEDPDNADERVKRSVSRSKGKSNTGEMPTTLNKSSSDDDEDGEQPIAKSEKADEGALTEDKVYERIAKGEGPKADDYREVIDASDAIAYLTDEMVKALVHVSKQVASSRAESKREIDAIRKSLKATTDANVLLLKSMAHILREQETLAKSESAAKAPKSDGRVVVVTTAATPAAGAVLPKAALIKSLSKALSAGTVDPAQVANVTANLDAVPDVTAYWAGLPKTFTDAVAAAGAN